MGRGAEVPSEGTSFLLMATRERIGVARDASGDGID